MSHSLSQAVRTIAMVAACPFPAPRGTPIRALRLAEEMVRRGHRVHVVTYHHGIGEADGGLRVHRIPEVKGYADLSPGPHLRKLVQLDPALVRVLLDLLRRERVDVIHAHHYEGLLVGWTARRFAGHAAPLVFDVHTMLASELPTYRVGVPTWVKRRIGSSLDRRLPPLADHVASCTERIRELLVAAGTAPAERVTVVPNGVEPDRYAGEPADRVVGAAPRLVFTGNLAEYQGIDLMLQALRFVLARCPGARLALVTGTSLERYEAHARELGVRHALDLVPWSPEAELRMLSTADVALNPRVNCDGIPMKLLNYMAAARPVVSFAGSAPGLTHRRQAWLVADRDVEGFAGGVLALLDQPRLARELGLEARRFVRAHHDWTRSAEALEGIYDRLLTPAVR